MNTDGAIENCGSNEPISVLAQRESNHLAKSMKTGHAFDKLQKSTNQKTIKHNEQIDKQLQEIKKVEPAKQS